MHIHVWDVWGGGIPCTQPRLYLRLSSVRTVSFGLVRYATTTVMGNRGCQYSIVRGETSDLSKTHYCERNLAPSCLSQECFKIRC